jgi:ABC-type nickel/cobalt efflux system permease component RcnA
VNLARVFVFWEGSGLFRCPIVIVIIVLTIQGVALIIVVIIVVVIMVHVDITIAGSSTRRAQSTRGSGRRTTASR